MREKKETSLPEKGLASLVSELKKALEDPRLVVNADFLSLETRILLIREETVRAQILEVINQSNELPSETISEIRKTVAGKCNAIIGDLDMLVYVDNLVKRVEGLFDLTEEKRREAIRDWFKSALDNGCEEFYKLVSELGKLNILNLVIEKRFRDNSALRRKEDVLLSEKDMLLPLELDCELFDEAVKVAQKHGRFDEWTRFISAKVGCREKTEDALEMDGAALPQMFPKISEYEKALMAYMRAGGGKKRRKFETMTRLFKSISNKIFGDKVEAFYTPGTLHAFKSLVLRFWEYFPGAELIAGPYEYLPMWYVVDQNKRHLVDVGEGLDFTEEDLISAMLEKETGSPAVLLISSQLRIGGKMLDTKKIAHLIALANDRLGCKHYHLWFDASQDARVIREGDVVFYSKRHGGTGGGMVVANKHAYPEDEADIRESFRTRSGFDSSKISRLVASLFSIGKHVGHRFSDLTKRETIGLWHFKGKGTFLSNEIDKAATYLAKSDLLRNLFVMSASLPAAGSGQWRIDTMVRIALTEKGDKLIDLRRLEEDLEHSGVSVSSFNLENCEREESDPSFEELMRLFDAQPFNLQQFIDSAEIFQKFYSPEIVSALLPAANRGNAEHVRKHFQRAVKDHKCFRLFVTAINRPDYLLDFVKQLEEAVRRQI